VRTTAWVRPAARLQSVRARVTAAASVVITAAVVLGVLLMYLLQMNSVRRTLDDQLRTYAAVLQQSFPDGRWPATLPTSNLDPNAEAQVVAADGTVLAASRNLVGLPPIFLLPPGFTTPVRQKAADGIVPNDVRVVGVRTTVAGRPVTIITGTPTDLLTEVANEFARHLLIGLPIILLLSALAVWLIVGRALRPVEQIRHAVTDITSADLSRRVPDPGTPDEIGRLALTMNEMLTRLEQSAQRQRRFVADASHELRSPLAAIRTTLEVGLAHPEVAPWPRIAGRAADQSIRLEGLIENLLRLAQADEGDGAVPDVRVDVGALLREITGAGPPRDAALELQVTGSPAVDGDAESLGRLFRNIIDNALRHASSVVRVTAVSSADGVEVAVADDGPGIPQAERERVFDRFVRLDSSRDRSTGSSGLGLAIAREITLAHHGEITIGDSATGGARVLIRLPASAKTSESVR
jgi:signal transduction histidine kinase